MKISVIMPCHNAAAHLARGVESALGQSFHDLELIVVDDGSTDDSLKILAGYSDPRLRIISQPKGGVSVARNRGIREARGDYLAFLDSDDSLGIGCLDRLYAVLQANPEAILAYCGWQNLGLYGGRGEPYIPPDYEGPDKWPLLLRDCPWPIHAALSRRTAVVSVGGFKEGLVIAEDYRLWLHLAAQGRIVRVPEVLAFYHFHDGVQATQNKANGARDCWQVKREFLNTFPMVAEPLGEKKVQQLAEGMLLRRGYECYWARDLEAARYIFRLVMKAGFGTLKDWMYMLPAFLPLSVHRNLIRFLSTKGD